MLSRKGDSSVTMEARACERVAIVVQGYSRWLTPASSRGPQDVSLRLIEYGVPPHVANSERILDALDFSGEFDRRFDPSDLAKATRDNRKVYSKSKMTSEELGQIDRQFEQEWEVARDTWVGEQVGHWLQLLDEQGADVAGLVAAIEKDQGLATALAWSEEEPDLMAVDEMCLGFERGVRRSLGRLPWQPTLERVVDRERNH
ncbi:MAG: hypothetical protein AAGK22_14085 [Acidobacteriota bacterium]